MISWLRHYLGKCVARWTHDWNYQETARLCRVCGRKEIVVGYYQLDMDLDMIRQWKQVEN